MDGQQPIMRLHAGGDSEAAQRWDARAQHDIGVLINRYLGENPAPPGSAVSARLEAVGRDLQALGADRLEELGLGRLRLAAAAELPISR
jgi:hypothetical protein